MATITKVLPSGSTDGAPVKVVATATAGTLFHTADATAKDEIYLTLTNTSTNDVVTTVEFGGATAPDFNVKFTVPANDTVLAIAGIPLTNSKTVKAFAATANVINMLGYVNRIS
jgi:hypothetical protein